VGKGYSGKSCAYCGEADISSTRDHVLAREFFLKKDRGHIPAVPACIACNNAKSLLEHYALTVLPFGSRHSDALSYLEENLGRRLARNHALRRTLVFQRDGGWERHPNGLIVPAMAGTVDTEKIYELFSFIVRGLYMYQWAIALDPAWRVDVQMFDPRSEHGVIDNVIRKIIGQVDQTAKGNIGRGTFVYEGVRSANLAQLSLWQFTVFGGLELGSDANIPHLRLSRFYAITRPK
jgi:hypothetical protein